MPKTDDTQREVLLHDTTHLEVQSTLVDEITETPLEPTEPQKIAVIEQAISKSTEVTEPVLPVLALDIQPAALSPQSETEVTPVIEQAPPAVTLEIPVEDIEPIKVALAAPEQPAPKAEDNAHDAAPELFEVPEQATKSSFEEIIASLQYKNETADQPLEIEPTSRLPELPITETFDILSEVLNQETSEADIPLAEIVALCADLEIPLLDTDDAETEQWTITTLTTILEMVGYENPAQLAEQYIADNSPQVAIDMISYLATLAKSYDAQEKSVAANVASTRLASTNKLGSWLLVLLAPRQHTISI